MRKRNPTICITCPDDELVTKWIAGQQDRKALFDLYKEIPVPTNNDDDWYLQVPPVVDWEYFRYRQHASLKLPSSMVRSDLDVPVIVPEKKRKHEYLFNVAANKRTQCSFKQRVNVQKPLVLQTHLEENDILLEKFTIILEKNAHVTINDNVTADEDENFIGRSIQIILQPGAQLNYIFNQQLSKKTKQMVFLSVFAYADARFEGYLADHHGAYRKYVMDFYAHGPYAQIHFNGISQVGDKQQMDYVSYQIHRAPKTSSLLKIKGLVNDHGRMRYNGCVIMGEDAGGSDAEQQSAALLLSPSAQATAIPSLEICAHDVDCRHGSAIGKVQNDDLFYLQARGLSYKQAKYMIVKAFIESDLPESLKNKLEVSKIIASI